MVLTPNCASIDLAMNKTHLTNKNEVKTDSKHGLVLWLLGPTSCGKTTIARRLLSFMRKKQIPVIHYDGDEVRDFFGPELGFAKEQRFRVVKTLVHLTNKAAESGLNVIVSALTANPDARRYVFDHTINIITGYVKCSIDECAKRDPKGLYKQAKNGEISTLIGYNTEYNEPENPDLVLDSEQDTLEELVAKAFQYVSDRIVNYRA